MEKKVKSFLLAALLGCICCAVPAAAEESAIRAHDAAITAVGLFPDGTRVVTGDEEGRVKVWEEASGRLLEALQAHNGPVNDLQVSPNGKALATAGADNSIRVFSLSSYTLVRSVKPPERQKGLIEELLGSEMEEGAPGARAVCFSGDTRFVASGHGDLSSLVWDLKTGRYPALQGDMEAQQAGKAPANPVLAVALSPDGRLAAAGERETEYQDVLGKTSIWAHVFIWNPYTAEVIRYFDAGRSVVFLGFLPDNRHLIGALGSGSIVVWDATSGKQVKNFDHGGGVRAGSLSADGRRLVTASRDSVKIWEIETGAVRSIQAQPGEEFTDASLNGDGGRIAVGTTDGRLLLGDVGVLELEPIVDEPPPPDAVGGQQQPDRQQEVDQQPIEQLWDE